MDTRNLIDVLTQKGHSGTIQGHCKIIIPSDVKSFQSLTAKEYLHVDNEKWINDIHEGLVEVIFSCGHLPLGKLSLLIEGVRDGFAFFLHEGENEIAIYIQIQFEFEYIVPENYCTFTAMLIPPLVV